MSVGFPVTHVLVKQILNLIINFLLAHLASHVWIGEVHISAGHFNHHGRLVVFLFVLLFLIKSWLVLSIIGRCFLVLGKHGDHGLDEELFEIRVCLIALINLGPDVGQLPLQGVDLVDLVSVLLKFLFHSCDVSMSQISLSVSPLSLLGVFAVKSVNACSHSARLPVSADMNGGVLHIGAVQTSSLVWTTLALMLVKTSLIIARAICIEMAHDLIRDKLIAQTLLHMTRIGIAQHYESFQVCFLFFGLGSQQGSVRLLSLTD